MTHLILFYKVDLYIIKAEKHPPCSYP